MENLINRLNKIIVNVYSGQNNEDTEKQLEELKILMKKKGIRGGTRRNAGAKPKYNEQTKTVAFRCPISKVDELKLVVNKTLIKWQVTN